MSLSSWIAAPVWVGFLNGAHVSDEASRPNFLKYVEIFWPRIDSHLIYRASGAICEGSGSMHGIPRVAHADRVVRRLGVRCGDPPAALPVTSNGLELDQLVERRLMFGASDAE